jgi:ribosomal-protein-alanine N-acetyltransferase
MISEIEVVKAKVSDIKRIIEIEELSYSDPWPREIFMVDYLFNSSSEYFVAKMQGKIVGFIGIWYEGKKLHVINVAVHPDERGKGIGTNLLLFAINLAKELGYEAVYLEARKSNVSAQRLYRKLGFKEKEELKGYYQDGEDGIRMELSVPKEEKES